MGAVDGRTVMMHFLRGEFDMPIREVNDPEYSRRKANKILSEVGVGLRKFDIESTQAPFGGVVAVEIGVLPLYNIHPEALAIGNLDAAAQTAWRYIRLSEGSDIGDIVDVDALTEGDSQEASLARGSLAVSLAKAAERAEAFPEKMNKEFEARILRIPEIHLEVFWLQGESGNYMFSLTEETTDEPAVINEDIQDRVKNYLEQSQNNESATIQNRVSGPPLGG